MPRLRVIKMGVNEGAASLRGKWLPTSDRWMEASRDSFIRPAQLSAALTPHGKTVTQSVISVDLLRLTMHCEGLAKVGMVSVWPQCSVRNLFRSWMRVSWLSVPGFRPRPSAQKASVSTLGRSGFLVCSYQTVLVSERNIRLQSIRVLSIPPSAALVFPHLQIRVVSSGPFHCVISTVIDLPCQFLCGEGHILGILVCGLVSGCRVSECNSLVDGVAQGVALEVVLLLHDPQPHSAPPLRKSTHQELGGDEAEREGGEGERCARSVLTLPLDSGFLASWIMPHIMSQSGSRNVSTQPCQKSQRSHDHPRLFRALDYNLRRLGVRWREEWREQVSLQGMILPTQIQAPLIHTPVLWWRNNHPPPWMSKSFVWLLGRLLLQLQNGGSMVLGRFSLTHVVSVMCFMSGMYGSSVSVKFPLASAGIGSFFACN